MILRETLRAVVMSQRQDITTADYGTERERLKDVGTSMPLALIISGARRCGKSTLLKQAMKKTKRFYYFNFEDSRISGFEPRDFHILDEILREEFGDSDVYFFDEIQNVDKWEIFVRSMLDKKKHFIITGSNASLLSKELGTKLTGRHLRIELFPFSYKEFLRFMKKDPSASSFEEYMTGGGFPEYLKIKRTDVLRELLEDIIARDIVVRHKLRNAKTVKEMAVYLLTNVGKEFSYTALGKTFNLGSTTSAINFVSYFEDSYILFTVQKFSYSLRKMAVNPKKAYSVDNGLAMANSASFSEDRGRMLENAVFLSLRRRTPDIFYYKEKGECDFVLKQRGKITEAIQVCYKIDESNRDREVNGLAEAMEKFNLKEGVILTFDQNDSIAVNDKKITIKPVWKWLLESIS